MGSPETTGRGRRRASSGRSVLRTWLPVRSLTPARIVLNKMSPPVLTPEYANKREKGEAEKSFTRRQKKMMSSCVSPGYLYIRLDCTDLMMLVPDPPDLPVSPDPLASPDLSGPCFLDAPPLPDLGTRLTILACLTTLTFPKSRLIINPTKYNTIILLAPNFFHFSGLIKLSSGTVWERLPTKTMTNTCSDTIFDYNLASTTTIMDATW